MKIQLTFKIDKSSLEMALPLNTSSLQHPPLFNKHSVIAKNEKNAAIKIRKLCKTKQWN